MSRHTTVECEASVDVFELALDNLNREERLELGVKLLKQPGDFDRSGDKTLHDQIEQLALAIERCDGEAAQDLLHRVCMDVVGRPVINRLEVRPIGWRA